MNSGGTETSPSPLLITTGLLAGTTFTMIIVVLVVICLIFVIKRTSRTAKGVYVIDSAAASRVSTRTSCENPIYTKGNVNFRLA